MRSFAVATCVVVFLAASSFVARADWVAQQFQITTDGGVTGQYHKETHLTTPSSEDFYPDIWGDIVVWSRTGPPAFMVTT